MDEREAEKRINGDDALEPNTARSAEGSTNEPKDWASVIVVDRLLSRMELQLTTTDFKASVGDFIRLLEYRKKIEGDGAKEMYVRWAESFETGNVSAR